MLALSGNLHAGVRLLKILNHLACRAIQGFSIIGIALGLRHADDQPICKAAMAAAIVQDSSLGSKRNASSVAVGIFFPIVRIQIGRASCRERVEITVYEEAVKKKSIKKIMKIK